MKTRAFFLCVLVGACGGGGQEGGVGGGTTDLGGFWDGYLDYLCGMSIRCEAKWGFNAILQPIACHPGVSERFLDEAFAEMEAAIAAGRIRWDDAAAATCLAALRAVDSCPPGSEWLDAVQSSCDRVIVGAVPLGGDCLSDSECTRGGFCADEEACPGSCEPRRAEGEACESDLECVDGLECDGECGAPAEGECTSGSDCASGVCSSGTCVPLGGPGDPCEVDFFGGIACDGDLVCVGATDVEPGTCGAGGGPGEACDESRPCAPGLRCGSGACVRISPPGGACGDDVECPIGFDCEAGSCDPLPILGDPCSADRECLDGVCTDGVCALLPDGSPCDADEIDFFSSMGRECRGWCERDADTGDGTCAPVVGAGEPCDSDAACVEGLECTSDPETFERICAEACGS